MAKYFVPYSGKKPAALLVNGHRLVILSRDQDVFDGTLNLFGADRLKKVNSGDSAEEEQQVLGQIALSASAGIVVAPREVPVPDIIKNLETQLPWIQ